MSNEEAAELFTRSDIVVLPYRSATGSGVVPLAYHYGKPVIVTNVGGLPDVVEDGRTGVIVPPDSSRDLANAIRNMTAEKAEKMREAITRIRHKMTWDGLATAVLEAASGLAEEREMT